MLSSSSLALLAELLDDQVRHGMLRAWLRGEGEVGARSIEIMIKLSSVHSSVGLIV
jgi:hypothetical protein